MHLSIRTQALQRFHICLILGSWFSTALWILELLACQPRIWEGSHYIQLPPMGQTPKGERRRAQVLQPEDLNSPPAFDTCKSSTALARKMPYHLANISLNQRSGMRIIPLCLLRNKRCCIPPASNLIATSLQWMFFLTEVNAENTERDGCALKCTDIKIPNNWSKDKNLHIIWGRIPNNKFKEAQRDLQHRQTNQWTQEIIHE